MIAKFRDGTSTGYSVRPPASRADTVKSRVSSVPPRASTTRLKRPSREPSAPPPIEIEEIVADLANDPRYDAD
jgi:hypothetical protein